MQMLSQFCIVDLWSPYAYVTQKVMIVHTFENLCGIPLDYLGKCSSFWSHLFDSVLTRMRGAAQHVTVKHYNFAAS